MEKAWTNGDVIGRSSSLVGSQTQQNNFKNIEEKLDEFIIDLNHEWMKLNEKFTLELNEMWMKFFWVSLTSFPCSFVFTIELNEMWMKKAWALSTETFHLFMFTIELNEV